MFRRARPSYISKSIAAIIGTALVIVLCALVVLRGYTTYEYFYDNPNTAAENQAPDRTGQDVAAETVAYYTKVLAWFTGVLALTSVFILVFLVRADSTARIFASAARDAANAATAQARESAKSRGIVAQQTAIADRQAQISYLQFVARNRPRFSLRNIAMTPDDGGANLHDEQLTGECYIENIGGMDAKIVDSHLEVFANQKGLPGRSPYEGKTPNNVLSGKLSVGESKRVTFSQTTPFTSTDEVERAQKGRLPIYVLGWVHYQADTVDAKGSLVRNPIYRLAFGRKWNAISRRFEPVKNQDYEHAG